MRSVASFFCAGVLGCFTHLVHAQSPAAAYPAKPVRLVVAFAPGGPADILGRLIAQSLSESWGQQVVVENRAGAGGTIGSDVVAKAPADGYHLLMVSSAFAISAALYSKLPFDPVADFAPVTLMVTVPSVLVVHPSLPVTSVKSLLALAKSKPGDLAFPSSGNGTVGHLAGELFKNMSGATLLHVPYKGTGPALVGLVSGETQLMFSNVLPVLPHVKSGRLKALAVTDAKRSPILPQLPTIAESGVPGYEVTGWFGIVAPAKTPQPIVDALHTRIAGLLNSNAMKERLLRDGAVPVANSPREFEAIIKNDIAKWKKVVKSANLEIK